MKIVQSENEFEEQIKLAIGEAKSAFGEVRFLLKNTSLRPGILKFKYLLINTGMLFTFSRENVLCNAGTKK
jgi:pyruvate carboxylase